MAMSPCLSSPELVARIVAGERDAEDELIRRYSRGVSTLLRRIAGDPSVAEDLHQETFRICIDKIRRGELREPEKLSAFMCSVARNLAIEHFRQVSRRPGDAASEPAELLADSSPSALAQLLQKEKAAVVRQVLSELYSQRDRELLYRFYVAEEDKEQICADLGLGSLQFNRVLFRARERFRELYQKWQARAGQSGRRMHVRD
jgi:RNA polymerase sigma-70 factor (ECF subfamily)